MWRLAVAYYWGFRDGWDQPYELLMSKNAEHLTSDRYDLDRVMLAMDHGINLGQSLRGGRKSQADREGYVPFALRWRFFAALMLLLNGWTTGRMMLEHGANGLVALYVVVGLYCFMCTATGWPFLRPKSLDRA